MEIRLQLLGRIQEGSEHERRQRMGIAEQEQQSHEQERAQRMHLAQESATMDQVTSRVNILQSSISAQHTMLLNTTNMLASTLGTNHPNFQQVAGHLVHVSMQPPPINVTEMMSQACAQLAQPTFVLPNNQLLTAQPHSNTPGPSNYGGHLHDFGPTTSRFEPLDSETEAEVLHAAGGTDDDAMEMVGFDAVVGEGEEDEEDDLYGD